MINVIITLNCMFTSQGIAHQKLPTAEELKEWRTRRHILQMSAKLWPSASLERGNHASMVAGMAGPQGFRNMGSLPPRRVQLLWLLGPRPPEVETRVEPSVWHHSLLDTFHLKGTAVYFYQNECLYSTDLWTQEGWGGRQRVRRIERAAMTEKHYHA